MAAIGGAKCEVQPEMPMAPEITKVTVNVYSTTYEALRSHAERKGITRTDAIGMAIAAWVFLQQAEVDGNEILLRKKKGGTDVLKFR